MKIIAIVSDIGKEERLVVKYNGGAIIENIDKAIQVVCKELGWSFEGSGMFLPTGERDLSFQRPIKKQT